MKIKFVNEIPQWIISSDVAAYHPASKTIWIRNNLGWKTIPTLLHELTHWFIHKFLGNNEKLHSEADKLLKYNYGIKYFKRFGGFVPVCPLHKASIYRQTLWGK